MSDLAKIDVRAIGTIRENRTAGANQKMIISKQLQNQERGCFEYCCVGTVYITKWRDIQLWRLQATRKVTLQLQG